MDIKLRGSPQLLFHYIYVSTSSTVLPVISDGNFGVVVTAVLTLELVLQEKKMIR